MSRKSAPYVFLAFLVALLLFIVGIRYGQHVERVNKTVTYLISIPPSPTTAPTTSPLSFDDFTHTGCKISIVVPSELTKSKESSSSAVFTDKEGALALALSCEKIPFVMSERERSVNLNKTIRAYETMTGDTVSYRFYHTNTTQVVTVTVRNEYLPLLQRSIAITQ